MIIKVIDNKDLSIVTNQYKASSEPVLIFGKVHEPIILVADKDDLDQAGVNWYNVPIIPKNALGGSIILNAGDLQVRFDSKSKRGDWLPFLIKSLKEFLVKNGIDITKKGNTLYAYNKKIIEVINNEVIIYMTNSQLLVRELLVTSRTKTTIGLYDYGISTKEIMDLIIDSINKFIRKEA